MIKEGERWAQEVHYCRDDMSGSAHSPISFTTSGGSSALLLSHLPEPIEGRAMRRKYNSPEP